MLKNHKSKIAKTTYFTAGALMVRFSARDARLDSKSPVIKAPLDWWLLLGVVGWLLWPFWLAGTNTPKSSKSVNYFS